MPEKDFRDQLSPRIEAFLQEVSQGLTNPKPPTFLQQLRTFWEQAPGIGRVVCVIGGVMVTSVGLAALGGAAYGLGEISHVQFLTEVAKGMLWTGFGGFIASALTYSGMSALCFFD